jgi:histidinol phosphatase-like PHP family hydrolase
MNKLSCMQEIKRGNIPKCDFHMHTNWTDGSNTSVEMHNAAITQGLTTILFSEHARKTSGDWFPDFAKEIRSLPDEYCKALVGVEAKVDDFLGNIDSVDEVLQECDLVMASVHRFPGESDLDVKDPNKVKREAIEIEKELSLAVLENKRVDILGHPFGMSLRRFNVQPSDDDFKEVIKKAAETGVAIEINSHYHRNLWDIIDWCKDSGALISLGSNAHDTAHVAMINNTLGENVS